MAKVGHRITSEGVTSDILNVICIDRFYVNCCPFVMLFKYD